MIALKETVSLDSYFLAPFQRLSRYRLLLENLQKALEKENNKSEVLQRAIDIIKTKLDKANTLAAINSISNCPPNLQLNEKGNFLIKEKVNLKGKYKSVVFVFEEVVIFTVEDKVSGGLKQIRFLSQCLLHRKLWTRTTTKISWKLQVWC